MNPLTFLFFGPSGSGKGTQANLLMEKLKEKDPEGKILYLETGKRFREFAQGQSLTSKILKEVLAKGGLAPEFLPIWIWTEYLVNNIAGDEHLFIDGSPRKLEEAKILDSALRFYNRENTQVISLHVSDKWATKLLKKRSRSDDTDESIKERLDWYHNEVTPVINYFEENSYYKFISINGEQTIEEVRQEIMAKTGL